MLLASSLLSTSAATFALGLGAGAKGAVTVDVDLTFLWSILVFVVLALVLKPLLFEPMLRLFEERERRIEGTKAEARKLDDAAGQALSRYEDEMKKARAAGNLEREAHRADGQKIESENPRQGPGGNHRDRGRRPEEPARRGDRGTDGAARRGEGAGQGDRQPGARTRGAGMTRLARRVALVLALGVASVTLLVGPTAAAAEQEDEAGPPKDINWVDFHNKKQPPYLAAFINVAIVAFLYVYWGKKPIQAALKARRDDVARQIDEARTIKQEAEARSKEYAVKLEHLGQEVEATRAALVASGEGEKARILREAEEKAVRMRKDALFLLEQEKKQIRIDLQRDTVATAMTLAEELLHNKLTAADHERVAEEFLATLVSPKTAGGAP